MQQERVESSGGGGSRLTFGRATTNKLNATRKTQIISTHLRATGAARIETRMDACIVLKEGTAKGFRGRAEGANVSSFFSFFVFFSFVNRSYPYRSPTKARASPLSSFFFFFFSFINSPCPPPSRLSRAGASPAPAPRPRPEAPSSHRK